MNWPETKNSLCKIQRPVWWHRIQCRGWWTSWRVDNVNWCCCYTCCCVHITCGKVSGYKSFQWKLGHKARNWCPPLVGYDMLQLRFEVSSNCHTLSMLWGIKRFFSSLRLPVWRFSVSTYSHLSIDIDLVLRCTERWSAKHDVHGYLV